MAVPHIPRTAEALVAAIDQGVLVESLSFDAKAELESGPRGNTRLAIDLAAFAVAGGLLAIGIAEEGASDHRRLVPRPVPLPGLRERVSQVGLSRVDPPVFVTTIELPESTPEGEASDGRGYLLILVPPSPDAPHMVDGRYRGRSDTTNYVLGDAEVRRIQAQRRRDRPDIGALLERAVERDPTPPTLRRHAHLFVVGAPVVASDPAMLQERLGRGWQRWIMEELVVQPTIGRFSPDLPSANQLQRRPDGWAAVSHVIEPGRTLRSDTREDDVLELEVGEDGSLALFCGRASDSTGASDVRWTFEVLLAGLTWRVVRAAAIVADKTDYFGNWEFGVALTNARGIASHEVYQRARWADPYPFADNDYRSVTQATYAEVSEHRSEVIGRLLGRLNRALNDDSIPLPDFDAPRT